jgi:hypothetical protein
MKRLLLIGLTTILGLSSLATRASADSFDRAAGIRVATKLASKRLSKYCYTHLPLPATLTSW